MIICMQRCAPHCPSALLRISWVHGPKKTAHRFLVLCWNRWMCQDLFPLQIAAIVRGFPHCGKPCLLPSAWLSYSHLLAYLQIFPSGESLRNPGKSFSARKGVSPVLPLFILMQRVTSYRFKNGLSGMVPRSVSCSLCLLLLPPAVSWGAWFTGSLDKHCSSE